MPRSGIAAACAACPRYTTSTSAMHTHGMFTRLMLEGCIIIAASTPSNAPSRAISSLPQPRSSAGVPSTRTRPGSARAQRRERDPRADARGRDQVVAAGVADLGQRVVLGEHRDAGRRSAPNSAANAVGSPYAPVVTSSPAPRSAATSSAAREALLERELGPRVDLAREAHQIAAHALDRLADFPLARVEVGGGGPWRPPRLLRRAIVAGNVRDRRRTHARDRRRPLDGSLGAHRARGPRAAR